MENITAVANAVRRATADLATIVDLQLDRVRKRLAEQGLSSPKPPKNTSATKATTPSTAPARSNAPFSTTC